MPLEILGVTAGALTAFAVILGTARVLYNFIKKIEKVIGEDKEGRSITERLGRVEHQVFPNGGGSLSDQVDAVSKDVTEVKAKTEVIENLLYALLNQITNAPDNNNKRSGSSPREPSQTATRKRKPKSTT